jgi:hypothetical protein
MAPLRTTLRPSAQAEEIGIDVPEPNEAVLIAHLLQDGDLAGMVEVMLNDAV